MTGGAVDDGRPFPDHAAQLDALARIEGQVRGVRGMVADRRYCVDILTQCRAIHAALRRVERQVFETHVRSCVAGALREGAADEQEKIDEILSLFDWDAKVRG